MSATPESRRHATLVVKVGDQKEEIDEMIAPLIRELWIAGISTAMSCQEEYRETAWIEFHFIDELERFLNIVAEYDAGGHSLYARIAGHGCSHAVVKSWSYVLTPLDIGDNIGDDAIEKRRVKFEFTANVYIPHQDIPILVERLATYNRRQQAKVASKTAEFAVPESAGAM
ncbi:MAG: hypothetical protein U0791_06975 [Gemmataceae bacterium]